MPTIPFQSTRGFKGFLSVNDGLKQNNGKLSVNNGNGLAIDNNGKLTNEWYNMQPLSDLDMNSNKITNLGPPAQPQDATSKNYVDSLAGTPALKDSLRAYYSFDGDYKDLTTNGYDGSANGTTFSNSTAIINQSLELSNATDEINVGEALAFKSGDFSVSLWFYPRQTSNSRRNVISIDKGISSNRWNLLYGAGGSPEIEFFTNDGGGSGIATDPFFQLNQWYHVVLTRTSGTGQIWVNGQLKVEGSIQSGDLSDASDVSLIGGDSGGNNGALDGFVDEVGAWDRVLSQGEIQHLYNNGAGNQYLSTMDWYAIKQSNHINMNDYRITNMGEALNGSDAVDKNYVDSRAPLHQLYQGARAYYDFEGNYNDSINGYDGTEQGGGSLSFNSNPALIGQSVEFSDVDGDYVDLGGSTFDFGTSDFTWQVWYNLKSNKDSGEFLHTSDNSGHRILVGQGTGAQNFDIRLTVEDSNFNEYLAGNIPNFNQWYHLVVVREGSNYRLYIDGIKYIDVTDSNNDLTGVHSRIGNDGQFNPDAYLDEVGTWDRALTENEIKYLYHEGKGTNDFVSYDYTFNYDLDMNDHTIINTEQVLMREVNINDDSVHKIPVTQNMGKIVAHRNTTDMIEALYDLSNQTNTKVAELGSGFTLNTGSASGTTGSDGNVNLFFNNGNSEVIIENRAGSTITMRYCIYA